MFRGTDSLKIKNFVAMMLIILVWEFSFPQHAVAREIKTDNSALSQTFGEQWLIKKYETKIRLPEIPDKPQPEAKQTMYINVTAYSSTPDQCSGDPFITASGTRVHDGTIAANFLPIGTKVRFPEHYGNKIFVVEDRMSSRYWYKADIWMPERQLAKEWGIKYTKIEIL